MSVVYYSSVLHFFFFFNDTSTTEIYTLSLHDALPILSTRSGVGTAGATDSLKDGMQTPPDNSGSSDPSNRAKGWATGEDRKSTRLNSSHPSISYAVFCLKKKKNRKRTNLAIAKSQSTI